MVMNITWNNRIGIVKGVCIFSRHSYIVYSMPESGAKSWGQKHPRESKLSLID
jgi:hypothetical protein